MESSGHQCYTQQIHAPAELHAISLEHLIFVASTSATLVTDCWMLRNSLDSMQTNPAFHKTGQQLCSYFDKICVVAYC